MARIAVDHSPHLRIVQSEAPWLDDVPPRSALDDEPWLGEEPSAPLPNGHDALDDLDSLNRDNFVAMQGGNTVIVRVEYDPHFKRDRHIFMSANAFRLFHNNRLIEVGSSKNGPVSKPLGSEWLTSPKRRTYQRMVLAPERTVAADTYNLWRGWGVRPKAGSWETIRSHWLDTVCGGDQELFDYLVGWIATKVQNPASPPEVSLVMRGEEGVGKGVTVAPILRMFGAHGLQISHPKHLTGAFNAHLLDCLFLYVDEAYWAGDRQGEGVLKALITEATIMLERKGADAFPVPNMLAIAMASNNDRVVPASAAARRYFVLDVPSTCRNNRPYFKKLWGAINGNETAALLHHLLALDLSTFEIRDVPNTKALAEQKLIGSDSLQQWWFSCLRRGSIKPGGEEWPDEIDRDLCRTLYYDWCRNRGEKHPYGESLFGSALPKLCPDGSIRTARPRSSSGPRPRLYQLATLDEHRKAFLAAMRITPEHVDWDETGPGGSN